MIVSAKPRDIDVSRAAVWLRALFVGLLICAAAATAADANPPAEFQPYQLNNVRAEQILANVRQLLPPGTDVETENQANRIWVRGSSQAQHTAQEVIRFLDKPTAASEPAVPAANPLLRVYGTPPGESPEVTAARWQNQFGHGAAVRVVPDTRTSQVLVLAPPEVHARIGTSPSQAVRAAADQADFSATTRWPLPPRVASAQRQAPWSQKVQLRYGPADRVERMLLEMLADRISPLAKSLPGTVGYRLTVAGGGTLALSFDRRSGVVTMEGPGTAVQSCVQLIEILDGSRQLAGDSTRLVPLSAARPADIRRTVDAIRMSNVSQARPTPAAAQRQGAGALVSMLYQRSDQPSAEQGEGSPAAAGEAPDGTTERSLRLDIQPESPAGESAGLIGPVQIELLEGLDTLVIRGHKRDVERVIEMIKQIETLSVEAQPAIEVYQLRHVNCEALAELVVQLYAEVFSLRQGAVSITALVKPNALLLIGRPESVETVVDLVKRLDRPVAPETQFRVFRLRHASSQSAQETIQGFFEERAALGTRVRITADFRTNSLIVQASPRDMLEVAAMIAQIDAGDSKTENELRLFKLNNSLATELAETLQSAINGAASVDVGQQAGANVQARSTMLRFITIDAAGQQLLRSGILTNVQITPDARANTLLVSAPAESMPLLEALVRQLDQLPPVQAQIKVFTIINSDATALVDMLETLFGQPTAAGEPAIQTGAAEEESSLVPLRFAVDPRTNSIIASGTIGDLSVVEAILLRLDETDVRNRKSTVYRLKNAPAEDVASAINEYLNSERQVVQITTELMSPFEQIEREVVVVPEPVSNSLIVSATPEYFEVIKGLVEKLDERPPMVMIQVLIAEVKLNDADEFGVELGLQDSILFDRSLLEVLDTTVNTVTSQTAGGATTTTQTENVVSANITPGFLFNNSPLGNAGSDTSLATSRHVGTQGLSHFDVGRINSELGFGGLVLSASSEAVSVLVRALHETRRLEILSRPQIMTLDNQPAYILVGERVPRVSGTQTNEAGQTNTIIMEDVGLILGVTPRINPDGLVVMELNTNKSEVGPEAEGIPISIAPNGDTIRSPRITTTEAETTVSAMSGQTIVLGGLITKSTSEVHRRVPLLADVPVLGNLFRYDLKQTERKELLIIMTPHIVESEEDAELLKQVEAARMHWCMADVMELMGDANLRSRQDEWSDSETTVIYPDLNMEGEIDPFVEEPTEVIPAPEGSPRLMDPTPSPAPTDATFAPPPAPQAVHQATYQPAGQISQRAPQPIAAHAPPQGGAAAAGQYTATPPRAETNPLRSR